MQYEKKHKIPQEIRLETILIPTICTLVLSEIRLYK